MGKLSGAMIALENLTYRYPYAESPTLQGVTVTIQPGELVLLTGHSGSGKSTLLYCLKGLIPQLYGGKLTGSVTVGGEDFSALSVSEIAKRVGLVMQDPESQFCNLFVRDEVAFGVENLKLEPALCASSVQSALEAVGLSHMADRQVIELSGGEKQKVAIACVLAMNVPVILLDEPAANLDAKSGREILQFISTLRDSGKTILLVQHELDEMIHRADKLMILERGSLLDFGPPRTLIEKYADKLTSEHQIGLPQIAAAALRVGAWVSFPSLPLTADEFASKIQPPPGAKAAPAEPLQDGKPAASGQPLVAAEHVSFTYARAKHAAVHDVSVEVRPGEVIAITGKNGSGKSTLARLLAGLLMPKGGIVTIQGTNIKRLSQFEIHRQTGYVFQYPEHQFLANDVESEISYGLEVQGIPEAKRKQIVADAIQSLKLSGLEGRHPFALSGGEKRRLSVATMLVLRLKLLILDEPTYGLDEGNLINLVRFIFDELRAQGITILFITHDMRLVAEHAERVLVMSEGRLMFDGAPSSLFADQALLDRSELLAPPIVELARTLAAKGIPVPPRTTTLDQMTRAFGELYGPAASGRA
jgi:energy-coupling factor transport system ATP-binding protein